jgi:hypothetical protein
VCGGVEAGEAEATLQKAEEPGNSIRPASFVPEVREDELCRIVFWSCACQNRDRDDRKATNRPDDGSLVDERDDRVAKGIDHEGDHIVGDVYQELVPSLLNIVGKVKWDDSDNELGTKETSGCCQGHPAEDIDPASDPAEYWHP